ncbi:PTS sugar transporter subunit IIA [Caldalkalibacillus salinus]|uniref:PTS sugar transporter subunit IIA n=1 Tax=Caldalkalibacillus salinus TaxID=2803787 RepID=UPI001920AD25|nr:fructose PTS transporter subunit IIA [Caldalkalibacillus salinus]
MNIADLLTEESILLSLQTNAKDACIKELTNALKKQGKINDAESYVNAVLKREDEGTTGIGFGVAIPHGKSSGVTEPGLAFAQLEEPVDWQSLDGVPVSIVFLIAVPESQAGNEHLQILSTLSRKLIHEEFREKLNKAKNSQEVLQVLQEA